MITIIFYVFAPPPTLPPCHHLVKSVSSTAHDTDQWVMMVADLMKTFPNYALFNLDEISDTAEEPFGDVLKELTKIVKKSTGDEAKVTNVS